MRRVGELPPAYTPIDRIRVLLAFKAAGVGAVLGFDEDLVPDLPGMERHTLMFVLTRLMSQVCVLPETDGTNAAKPARYFLTSHGLTVAERDISDLVEESEMARRLLERMGYEVPEPVVVAPADAAPGVGIADLTAKRQRRYGPGGDCL